MGQRRTADVYLKEPTRLSSQQVKVSERRLIIATDDTRKRDTVRLQTLVYTVWTPFTPVLGVPVSALNRGVNGVQNVL